MFNPDDDRLLGMCGRDLLATAAPFTGPAYKEYFFQVSTILSS